MGTGLLIDENEYFFKAIFYCFDYQTASWFLYMNNEQHWTESKKFKK